MTLQGERRTNTPIPLAPFLLPSPVKLSIGQTHPKLEDEEPIDVSTLASSKYSIGGGEGRGRRMEDSQPNKAKEDTWAWGG